ncbi:hypothetical protein TSAR_001730, partial [Trichomalopsis sarcophagae]
ILIKFGATLRNLGIESSGNVPKILGPAWEIFNLVMKQRTFWCAATLHHGLSYVTEGNVTESSNGIFEKLWSIRVILISTEFYLCLKII